MGSGQPPRLVVSNPARGTTLASRVRRANGYIARFKGLMLRRSLAEGEGLLLEPESSIHTFFMRFPIDVLYLDREYHVLRADIAMAPYRIGPLYTRGCRAILELPAGTILSSSTHPGDQLRIEPSREQAGAAR